MNKDYLLLALQTSQKALKHTEKFLFSLQKDHHKEFDWVNNCGIFFNGKCTCGAQEYNDKIISEIAKIKEVILPDEMIGSYIEKSC